MNWFRIALLTCCSAGALLPALTIGAVDAPKPKLIVAIAVDQLAAGLFDQYRDKYGYGSRRIGWPGAGRARRRCLDIDSGVPDTCAALRGP